MSISPARTIAYKVLLRVATQDAYADESLRAALDETVGPADAGLATEITLGVLRWQRLLDFLIDRNLTNRVKTLDIEVRTALRMGVYQIHFLERVPAHAAVNESVELVKKARKRSAAPLVNAVLRKAAAEPIPPAPRGEHFASLLPKDISLPESLGIQHSHPTWLVERWLLAFGEERTRALLDTNNRVPSLSAYVLDAKNREQAMKSLEKVGCVVKPGLLLRDAWTLHGGNPAASDAVKNSWLAIQDEASQGVARLLSVGRGNMILDLCAAPGGKTLLLSLGAGPQGHVVAGDLHANRVRAMKERLDGAGATNVETMVLDGTRPLPFEQKFDRILVDAPCSGTGTLARHPEIRWRLRPEDLADMHTRQVSLLGNAMPALAPGGRLVYSTCSLEAEENELVVSEALRGRENEFRKVIDRAAVEEFLRDPAQAPNLISPDGFFRTFPPEHGTDGFFAAAIECKTTKP
jgi:16S rRNA (cytosine967-C5)-methyltransferase